MGGFRAFVAQNLAKTSHRLKARAGTSESYKARVWNSESFNYKQDTSECCKVVSSAVATNTTFALQHKA